MKTFHLWIFLCSILSIPSVLASNTKSYDYTLASLQLSFPQAKVLNTQTFQIPIQFVGNLITVEARVKEYTGSFILDTGAQYLLLNERYFKSRSPKNNTKYIGNTGSVSAVARKKIDSLRWDPFLFLRVDAHVLDLSHLERKKEIRILGIIGFDILQDFEILLDYPSQQLILTRVDENGFRLDANAIQETPYDSLNFKLYGHMIVLKAKVQGLELRLSLDTGAEINLLDHRLKRKLHAAFEEIDRKRMLGVGKNTVEAIAGNLHGLRLGNQYEAEMQTLLTNLTEIRSAFHLSLDGVLGYEFLASRRTLINYKRKKLFFFHPLKP